MREGVEFAWFAPQMIILAITEIVVYHFQLLVCLHVINHSGTSLKRVDVIFCAVGMYVGRFWRIDISIDVLSWRSGEVDVFVDYGEF